MSFAVYPPALRVYASQLAEAHQAAEAARRYVNRYGTFSTHEAGLIGIALSQHWHLVAALDRLLTHLGDVIDASSRAMTEVAAHYERADLRAEATADAAYPSVSRPPVSRD